MAASSVLAKESNEGNGNAADGNVDGKVANGNFLVDIFQICLHAQKISVWILREIIRIVHRVDQ